MAFFKKAKFKKASVLILTPILFAVLGSLLTIAAFKLWPESENERIKDYYESEMATVVGATTLKKWIDEGNTDYILVDLRSVDEYNTEHFVTAMNIPAVSMNEEQLVDAFKALPKDKTIIIYCYSAYCTLGRQVGEALAQNGIYVKELSVGWSELKYHWDLWNPGAKITDGEEYIIKGSEPSTEPETVTPCVVGQFGC